MPEMLRLDASSADFDARLSELLDRAPEQSASVTQAVDGIVTGIRQRGDAALLEYTNRFDRRDVSVAADLEIPAAALASAWKRLPDELRAALETAATRIRAYARQQKLEDWEITDEYGNRLGQKVTAMDRVGVYVPGGKAAYPSSVLMNVIPAKVAGVPEVIMAVPCPDGELNDAVLGAAHLAGADRVFSIGGAQAVAALAYGTATVPAVDKIVGPGNAYVAAAKRAVFGRVGIDSIAGPSEIVVIGDGLTDPRWIAMDLFSQAEHDEDAQSILISPDAAYLDAVAKAMDERIAELPREKIVRASLQGRGALILVRDLAQAAEVSNRIAPEHLELSVAEPRELLERIRHAGAVFLGRHAPEAFGDYCAGPNHVLPTSRAARFSNPLGVYEFQKRSSLIDCTPEGARPLAAIAGRIADAEGLQAHAASARDRG
ncbi:MULTISPECIES: histidinol dehydrogenase [Hydrocarboniphaga]|uniref:Histidinol dehydrogenase n=1 Tax=Hydrocarboniphaga effusa AP103 TaxID=1172194 RepID=I8T9C0_9GAMM|nr:MULTISPECIES: histidinol dehydrogenase [Hydrocarboniphaga]EIT70388.1 histidinol dehydrogenase [Hydrocarboniphaga effusa AP103]MDZ4080771.1 histidinol dehydrogenase [Hydrocarboniphaga sp.]